MTIHTLILAAIFSFITASCGGGGSSSSSSSTPLTTQSSNSNSSSTSSNTSANTISAPTAHKELGSGSYLIVSCPTLANIPETIASCGFFNGGQLTLNSDHTASLLRPDSTSRAMTWQTDATGIQVTLAIGEDVSSAVPPNQLSAPLGLLTSFHLAKQTNFDPATPVPSDYLGINTDWSVALGSLSIQLKNIRFINLLDFNKLTSSQVTGSWYSNSPFANFWGIVSLKLNADSTASAQSVGNATSELIGNWQVEDSHVNVTLGATTSHFYFRAKEDGVFDLIHYTNYANGVGPFYTGLMIQQGNPIQLDPKNLYGLWVSETTGENRFIFQNEDWADSLSTDKTTYYQTKTVSGEACSKPSDLSCLPSTRFSRSIVRQNGNRTYWLENTESPQLNSSSKNNFAINLETKNPIPSSFGSWISAGFLFTFYDQTALTNRVWNFSSSYIKNSDKAEWAVGGSYFTLTASSNGKLSYTRDSKNMFLEITASNPNGFVVCEYEVGASCTNSGKHQLSGIGPNIKFAVTGKGKIMSTSNTKNSYEYFGNSSEFLFQPDTGYKVQAVSGCGGAWGGGSAYTTEIITGDCMISVDFQPIN